VTGRSCPGLGTRWSSTGMRARSARVRWSMGSAGQAIADIGWRGMVPGGDAGGRAYAAMAGVACSQGMAPEAILGSHSVPWTVRA
jgi:hypothetical protein